MRPTTVDWIQTRRDACPITDLSRVGSAACTRRVLGGGGVEGNNVTATGMTHRGLETVHSGLASPPRVLLAVTVCFWLVALCTAVLRLRTMLFARATLQTGIIMRHLAQSSLSLSALLALPDCRPVCLSVAFSLSLFAELSLSLSALLALPDCRPVCLSVAFSLSLFLSPRYDFHG